MTTGFSRGRFFSRTICRCSLALNFSFLSISLRNRSWSLKVVYRDKKWNRKHERKKIGCERVLAKNNTFSGDGLFKSVSIKFSISLLLRDKKNSYLKLGNQIKFLSINKKSFS